MRYEDTPDLVEKWQKLRWGNDKVYCPICGTTNIRLGGFLKKGGKQSPWRKYICNNCGLYFNDLTGTPFENAKISIRTIIAIAELTEMGMGVKEIAEHLELPEPTVMYWRKIFREEPHWKEIMLSLLD